MSETKMRTKSFQRSYGSERSDGTHGTVGRSYGTHRSYGSHRTDGTYGTCGADWFDRLYRSDGRNRGNRGHGSNR